jgi:ribonuclease BN (tRNA processing enzyme)
MDNRVVVLGGCGAWPEPGRACSGFLLEHDGFRVALDLGYGTLPRLLSLLGSATAVGLDAVIVTHDHPDHVIDLHGLFRARLYDGRHLWALKYHGAEDKNGQQGSAGTDGLAAYLNAEDIDGDDVVAWYAGHLLHHAHHGGDDWHGVGPNLAPFDNW